MTKAIIFVDSIIAATIVNSKINDLDLATHFIERSRWSIIAYSASSTSSHIDMKHSHSSRLTYSGCNNRDASKASNSYSNRSMLRSFILNLVSAVLEKWVISIELTLESLISIETIKHKMFSLLYHYRHFNDTDLKNLSCIDLITHRVRIKSKTKSASNITQKK